MLGDLSYRLGAALGGLEARLHGGVGGPARGGGRRPGRREIAVYDPDHDTAGTMEGAAMAAAATWIVSRFLRPKPVSWLRVVAAGIAATTLADLVGRTERRPPSGEEPYAEDSEELLTRMGAGVAVAAGYASLFYPLIPGPPLFRGLVFGGLEVMAAPRGGLVRLASATPGIRFPLQALALPVDEDASPLSHLAYGLGLGLVYRGPRSDSK